MGLFKKKTKKEEIKKRKPEAEKFERLPELPKLPEFPGFEESEKKGSLSKLPQFPDSSLGKKFSENTIKEAVSGEKEEDSEVPEADEFVSRREQRMPRPLGGNIRQPSSQPVPIAFREAARRVKEIEPIFIRIDKFEDSLHAFDKTKQQVIEIEKMLRDIKRLKEEEEKELSLWEREIQSTRQQIEKIDQDIFSRVE